MFTSQMFAVHSAHVKQHRAAENMYAMLFCPDVRRSKLWERQNKTITKYAIVCICVRTCARTLGWERLTRSKSCPTRGTVCAATADGSIAAVDRWQHGRATSHLCASAPRSCSRASHRRRYKVRFHFCFRDSAVLRFCWQRPRTFDTSWE